MDGPEPAWFARQCYCPVQTHKVVTEVSPSSLFDIVLEYYSTRMETLELMSIQQIIKHPEFDPLGVEK
jgi:hypothetical protein